MDSIYAEHPTGSATAGETQLHHKLQKKHRHPDSYCCQTAPSSSFSPFFPNLDSPLITTSESLPPEDLTLPGVKI